MYVCMYVVRCKPTALSQTVRYLYLISSLMSKTEEPWHIGTWNLFLLMLCNVSDPPSPLPMIQDTFGFNVVLRILQTNNICKLKIKYVGTRLCLFKVKIHSYRNKLKRSVIELNCLV
jgi:hypothetical protein